MNQNFLALTDTPTKTNDSAAGDADVRHYVGLWHLDVSDSSDILACLWRERRQWRLRMRLRDHLVGPLSHETRLDFSDDFQTEHDARSFVEGACGEVNTLQRPLGFVAIGGDAEKAMEIVFGNPDLLRRARDIEALPVLPADAVEHVDTTSATASPATLRQRAREVQEFARVLAASCELPPWRSDQVTFWVLDIEAEGPAHELRDAKTTALIRRCRRRWLNWAQRTRSGE